MEKKQLYQNKKGEYNKFFPLVDLNTVLDSSDDKTLNWIILGYNHLYVEWRENAAVTRDEIPLILRHNGLHITYNNGSGVITEFYTGSNSDISNYAIFTSDDSWEKVPSIEFLEKNAVIPEKSILPEHLSDTLQQLIADSDITIHNFPDEEDITQNGMYLKFRDRLFQNDNVNGLGYKILRKNLTVINSEVVNVLTQDMISSDNTIYEIRYDYVLKESITIPENCILKFTGGTLCNGTLVCQNTDIVAESDYGILNNVRLQGTIKNSIIYPEWFGAIGDNETDDTDALRLSIYNANAVKSCVGINKKKNFLISGTLNYFDDEYKSYQLSFLGIDAINTAEYSTDAYGGCIRWKTNISVFKNAILRGFIRDVKFVGVRTLENYFFDTCSLNRLDMDKIFVSQVGAFMYNTEMAHLTKVRNSTFLTVYYFSKCTVNKEAMDSFITNNYINGGMEYLDENSFCQWASFNGTVITHNFIDYYKTMYEPKRYTNGTFTGPISANNNYQVFLYFYWAGSNINRFTFSSDGDSFNHTSGSAVQGKFTLKEGGKTINGTSYVVRYPSYIFFSKFGTDNICITNAKLESNLASPIVVGFERPYDGLQKFTVANSRITGTYTTPIIGNYVDGNFVEDTSCKFVYNSYKGSGSDNRLNCIGIDTNFVYKASSLPNFSASWCRTIPGTKVRLTDGSIYTAIMKWDTSINNHVAFWQRDDELNTIKGNKGSTSNRNNLTLTSSDSGYIFYDTTLNKPLWWTGSSWVDATGTTV